MVHALGHPLNPTHIKIFGSAYMPSSKLSTLSHRLDPWYTSHGLLPKLRARQLFSRQLVLPKTQDKCDLDHPLLSPVRKCIRRLCDDARALGTDTIFNLYFVWLLR